MRERWRALRDRVVDIQISTIDAFCFGLLREFPLEAGVEPGFDVADETEMGRFGREAMDLAMRACRGLLADDEALRLLFARVKLPVLSRTVGALLDRRHLAVPAVASFVKRRAADATAGRGRRGVRRRALRDIVTTVAASRGPDGPGAAWARPNTAGSAPTSAALDAFAVPGRPAEAAATAAPDRTVLPDPGGQAPSEDGQPVQGRSTSLRRPPRRRTTRPCSRWRRRSPRPWSRSSPASTPCSRADCCDCSRSPCPSTRRCSTITRCSILPACSIGPCACWRSRRNSRAAG